jgi:hypothetical protein
MSTPTFVVSTGRCGSTMLSNMLREHAKVLSLSEFFGFINDGTDQSPCYSVDPLDGAQFWAIIAAPNRFSDFAYRHKIPCPELLYDVNGESARFSSRTGVPGILVTALPHISPDPDAVFAALQEEVPGWPVTPMEAGCALVAARKSLSTPR